MVNPLYTAIASASLLLLRAAASAAETCLGSVSARRAQELADQGRRGRALAALKADPEKTAAALRAGQVLTLIFAAILAVPSALALVAPLLPAETAPQVPAALAGGLLAMLAATLSEMGLRALALARPEPWALRLAPLVRLFGAVTSPGLRSMAAVLDYALAPFGAHIRFSPPKPPLEELERFIAEEAGKRLDPSSPQLIHSIFEMNEKSAREVMVPRTRVLAVEIGTPPSEVVRLLSEEGHTRIPVFREDIDHIVGVLHARDFVPLLNNPELIVLADIIRPTLFVPWAKRIGELLRELQRKKFGMAMVVDEYGGFMGVVTLGDILEEIVGEMRDEFDDEEKPDIESTPDGHFLVRAAISLQGFNRAFFVEIPPGTYETLGGYLNFLAGVIPEAGDSFFFSGLQFTVLDRTPRRVRRVRVSRIKKGEAVKLAKS